MVFEVHQNLTLSASDGTEHDSQSTNQQKPDRLSPSEHITSFRVPLLNLWENETTNHHNIGQKVVTVGCLRGYRCFKLKLQSGGSKGRNKRISATHKRKNCLLLLPCPLALNGKMALLICEAKPFEPLQALSRPVIQCGKKRTSSLSVEVGQIISNGPWSEAM